MIDDVLVVADSGVGVTKASVEEETVLDVITVSCPRVGVLVMERSKDVKDNTDVVLRGDIVTVLRTGDIG